MPPDELQDFEPPSPPGLPGLLDRLRKPLKIIAVFVFGLVIVVVVGLAAGFNPPWVKTFPGGLDISVSEPELNGDILSGSFVIHHALYGINSNKTGGACMVADIASLVPDGTPGIVKGTCTNDDACTPTKSPTPKYWGYCVHHGNQPGTCWYKATALEKQVCQKSKFAPTDTAIVWTVGEEVSVPAAPPFDVHAFYREHTGGRPTKWVLIGCLNGQTPGCADPNSNDKRVRIGDAVQIP